MTKQVYKVLAASALSLFLISHGVNASKAALREEMGDLFSRPKVVTQGSNPDVISEDQEKEGQLLSSAIHHLENKEVDQAVNFLKKAVDINGSPLAYLYLSALWNDARYHRIVFSAMEHKLISKKTVAVHAFFLGDLGYTFDLQVRYIPVK